MFLSLGFLVLFFSGLYANAAGFQEFKIPTTDGKSFITGQFDLPPPNTCGLGPYKAVMIVSGSGWSYRDGLMGNSGTSGDYIYKFMSETLQSKCYLVVRWDYRGVTCDRKLATDVSKCIDQKIRSEMDHSSMHEDILSVYNYAENFSLIDKSEFKVIGHSEGSLNVATLISQNKIFPKGVLFMGALTESPKEIFYWQVVQRKIEWLFELDSDGDQLLTNDEIKSGYSTSLKLPMLGPVDQLLSPSGKWTKGEYIDAVNAEFLSYKNQILSMGDDEPFYLGNIILAKASYWKMWFLDDVPVLRRLSNYSGKVIYMNGDIDSQTPGEREKYFLDQYSLPMIRRPQFKLFSKVGHCFGDHALIGPIKSIMINEIYNSLEEL